MLKLRRHLDAASLIVMLVTLVLFVTAVIVKGIGHELLLEAGVFLVSVKLLMMAYKISVATSTVAEELRGIRASLAQLSAGGTRPAPSVIAG